MSETNMPKVNNPLLNKDAKEFVPRISDGVEQQKRRPRQRGPRKKWEDVSEQSSQDNGSSATPSKASRRRRNRKKPPTKPPGDKSSDQNLQDQNGTSDAIPSEAPQRRRPKKKPPAERSGDRPSEQNLRDNAPNPAPSKAPRKRRPKKKPPAEESSNKPSDNDRSKPKRRNPKKKKQPWKSLLPPNSVDPISLEPLSSLHYPPFALKIEPPYESIPIWPVPGEDEPRKHHHLFDGRVLAYYLVSQLQFIDPMNRRDLTKPELQNLDSYLARHRLGKAKVVEAYENHGITISAAGAAGQTARGRAEILQQEARSILGALFAGERQRQRQRQNQNQRQNEADRAGGGNVFRDEFERDFLTTERTDTVTRGGNDVTRGDNDVARLWANEEDGGMLIIDDDENPGLRGGVSPAAAAAAPGTLWPTSHVSDRVPLSTNGPDNFPALPSAESPTADPPQPPTDSKPSSKPSRSLLTISKLVSKTDPDEIARQKAAREEAQRRAALSQLSYGFTASTTLPTNTTAAALTPPNLPSSSSLEAQHERNRILASALNIAPRQFHHDWSRPDTPQDPSLAVTYPDSLLSLTRDKLPELLKLEKKFKTFLADNTAPSLSLPFMDREMRKIVHEYAVFWKLKTESFDPEPKRYVHCGKLRDTSAPYPLLSEAVRHWKGPAALVKVDTTEEKKPQQQQQQLSREFPRTEERKKLELLPRNAVVVPPPGAMFDLMDDQQQQPSKNQPLSTSSRFEALNNDRERNKLVLAPRTIPSKLPPLQNPKETYKELSKKREEEIEREKTAREENQKKEMKILEKVFASSDEDSDSEDKSDWESSGSSSSEWEVNEAEYQTDDEEKEK